MSLTDFSFDLDSCVQELGEFDTFLKTHTDLKERADVLPFFKKHKHLSAYISTYNTGMEIFDKLDYEYGIYGKFSIDLMVGDSKNRKYTLIEFEDAKPTSIFQPNGNKKTLEWSHRFDHGFSQFVDWLWKFDDFKVTKDYQTTFGKRDPKLFGILVIGRNKSLPSVEETERMEWRSRNVSIGKVDISCVTFDDLYSDLKERLTNGHKQFASSKSFMEPTTH